MCFFRDFDFIFVIIHVPFILSFIGVKISIEPLQQIGGIGLGSIIPGLEIFVAFEHGLAPFCHIVVIIKNKITLVNNILI